jgi:hypothetical protein
VSDLLNEGVATFLHRADKIDLHAAAVREVEESFASTFVEAAFKVSPDLYKWGFELYFRLATHENVQRDCGPLDAAGLGPTRVTWRCGGSPLIFHESHV